MTEILLTLMLVGPGHSPSTFDIQTDLQGLYDEISQATLQFSTASDIDEFHDVICTPDWVFVDAAGLKQSWQQARAQAIQALSQPQPDSINQAIEKISLGSNGATVAATMTTVRTVVDDQGHYGRAGASHTLTETTAFRDNWVRAGDTWKLASRTQLGRPAVTVDKPAWNTSEDWSGRHAGN